MGIKENLFQYILGATALFVATVAGFFSVLGIGMLFSGAATSSMLMASSLEIGKVVATSFLYRYWSQSSKFLRAYLIVAVTTLVLITSLGVFGWLSSAYQSSAAQYENSQRQVSVLMVQKKSIEDQISSTKARLDNLASLRDSQEKRMTETLNNNALSRNPTQLRQLQDQNISLIKQTSDEIVSERKKYNQLYDDISEIDRKSTDILTKSTETKDIVTFKFVADAIGWDLNKTVKWFIVVIIIVFDPLAVCLILSYNVAAFGKKPAPTKDSQKVEKTLLIEQNRKPITDTKIAADIVNATSAKLEMSSSAATSPTMEPLAQTTTSSSLQPNEKREVEPNVQKNSQNSTGVVEEKLHSYEYFSSPTR